MDRQRNGRGKDQDPLRGGGLPRVGCGAGGLLVMLLIAALISPWLTNLIGGGLGNQYQISYTTFRKQLTNGNVEQITVSGQQIEGQLKSPIGKDTGSGSALQYDEFTTFIPSFGDEELFSLLDAQGVDVKVEPSGGISWWVILLNVLPFVLMIGFGYMLFSRGRAQGDDVFSLLKMRDSGAKSYDRAKGRTTFDDVAGASGAKQELREIIAFLKDPRQFRRLGGKMPKGVLLVGPPGTGKTLLARAVAGEANVPFLSITGSDFMEMFVGVGASRVRNLFEEAKRRAPSIIFIDELDSIGRRRGAGLGGGHDEREQTLNQLLSEMDGFEANHGVIVMAATNRPDILDTALLRPGRFDRHVTVDLPTMRDRFEILQIHARGKPLSDQVDLDRIARGTPGFSGADLENLLNEAALLAARRGKDALEPEDIDEARDKVIMGLERANMALTEPECRLLAYHEGGHAVVAAVLPYADPIHKVTIVPRGQAMGVTQQLPKGDRYIYPREYMMDRLAVMMGGRAAESLVLGTLTSGAENDLKQAVQLARKMVLEWGMSKGLANVALGGQRDNVFLGEEISQRHDYSEETAREVDQEVRAILDESYQRAYNVLSEYREALDRVADALVADEIISGELVLELLGVDRLPEKEEASCKV